MKRQAADMPACLQPKCEHLTQLDDKIAFNNVIPESLLHVLSTGETDLEIIEKSKGLFVYFTFELCIMQGVTNKGKTEIPTLFELITAQSVVSNRRATFVLVTTVPRHDSKAPSSQYSSLYYLF